MPKQVTVRIPATTANLGPGFDCLAMALDLWNETTLSLEGEGIRIEIIGEGQDILIKDERNLLVRTVLQFFRNQGVSKPSGLHVVCNNSIPLSSGLGSSASAVLAGLLGARALLEKDIDNSEILRLAVEIEGHADNAAAALFGGLIVVIQDQQSFYTYCVPVPPLEVVYVLPDVRLPTRVARAALPKQVPLSDVVFNLGRTALVVEALRNGDLSLLQKAMQDSLHQPYRLKLIPGATEAFQAAQQAGASGVALSGAGPGLVAFCSDNTDEVADAISGAFKQAGITTRTFILKTTAKGAEVSTTID